MKFYHHVLLIISALSLIIVGTVILPITLEYRPPITLTEYPHPLMDKWNLKVVSSKEIKVIHLSALEQIKKELGPIQVSKRRTGSWPRPEIWYFERGHDLVIHVMHIQKLLKHINCSLISSKESSRHKRVDTQFKCPNSTETQTIRFQLSKKWAQNIARISVLFEVEKEIDIQNLAILDSLNFSFGLVLNPYYVDSNLTHDLRKLKHPNLLLKAPFEEKGRNPDNITLSISNSPEILQTKINRISKLTPGLLGLLPVMGSLALNHSHFLDNFMQIMHKRKLIFAIPHKNNNSIIEQSCTDHQVNCLHLARASFSNKNPADFIKAQIKESRKRGSSILTLPLKKNYLYAADSIFSDFDPKGIALVELNQISNFE
jgi:hypothetical protein